MSSQPSGIPPAEGVGSHLAGWDPTRVARTQARIKRLWDFYAFHQSLALLGTKLSAVASDLHAIERHSSDLDAREAILRAAEARALALDDGIRTWRFHRRFVDRHLPADVVTGYLSLVVANMGSDPSRRDRAEFVATQLVSVSGVALRAEEALPLLEKLGGHRAEAAARIAAERWLYEVMERIQSASGVDEIFDGGVLLDLKVFKLSLGLDLVDPAILHAVVMLNLEILSRLSFLAEADRLPPGEVSFRFWKMDLQLQRLLRRQQEMERVDPAPLPKVDWTRYRWRNGKGPRRRPAVREASPRKPIRILLVALALAGLTEAALSIGSRPQDGLAAIAPDARGAIPAVVTLVEISGHEPAILAARVDRREWLTMTPAAKERVAEDLRNAMPGLHVTSALVRDGTAVAIQIEGNRILLVR